MKKFNNLNRGVITAFALVFSFMFLILLGGLLGFVLLQLRSTGKQTAQSAALHIAEAGIDYYYWHLSHFPEDLQDGNSWCCQEPPCSQCGPFEHQFQDASQKVKGKFSLQIQGTIRCGKIGAVTITSTGWTDDYPEIKRTVRIKYMKPTVADYAYLLNDNVWAGADREIKGPYHSNGGIRMDGENKNQVTSQKSTWICTNSFGCSPCPTNYGCRLQGANCVCPGVFTTANGNQELFSYPVPPFDFTGITMDLAAIKDLTKNQGQGLYLGPSGKQGYYVILKENRSIDVYVIDSLSRVYAYSTEQGWHWEYSVINKKRFLANHLLDDECGLVFIEDDLWLEGKTTGKLTIVSADLTNPNKVTNVWLTGNIEYTTKDGSDGLLLLSQNNLLIGLYSPNYMELHGTYIAQQGHFGRNHYPGIYRPYNIRESLEIFGTIVSNGRVGTQWVYNWGGIASGYKKRENIYDSKQSFNPSPFLPVTSENFERKEWEEI